MRVCAYLAAVVVLAGCASDQEMALSDINDALKMYGPACEKLGFKRDTPEFADCIIRLSVRTRR